MGGPLNAGPFVGKFCAGSRALFRQLLSTGTWVLSDLGCFSVPAGSRLVCFTWVLRMLAVLWLVLLVFYVGFKCARHFFVNFVDRYVGFK